MRKEIINLLSVYSKILVIDFNVGEYRAWKISNEEHGRPTNNNIMDYWIWFRDDSGLLHPNDKQAFTEFIENPLKHEHCCYKRLINGEWRQAIMRVLANDNNNTHILTVEDITSIYEIESDRIKSIDEMTGCLNNYALNRDVALYTTGAVGIIFADLNGLKYINDNKGHHAGDQLILKFVQKLKDRFSDCKIYRRGGDEFVVIATNIKLRHFISRARAFHKELWRIDDEEFPLASIGFSVDIEAIDEVLDQAETEMYYDKRNFKKFYPQFKR